jgi:hypothetical protein
VKRAASSTSKSKGRLMSIPIDDETYGDKQVTDPAAVKQGNPGKSQAELGAAAAQRSDDERLARDLDRDGEA